MSLERWSLRGGERSIPALLALVAICLVVPGCGKKPPPPPKCYIRMDALLPVHPLWSQMAALDSAAAVTRTATDRVDALNPTSLTSPPLIQPPLGIPASLERERRARMSQDARVRIAKISDRLRRRNAEILGAEEQTARKELAARIERARFGSNARMPGVLAQIAMPYDRKLFALGFKADAYRSQTRISNGQVLADAQLQLNLVENMQKQLADERDAKEADARSREETRLLTQGLQWTHETSARMAARGKELDAQITRQIFNEEMALRSQAEPIPPLGGTVKVNGAFVLPPLPAATGPQANAQKLAARSQVAAARDERLRGLLVQRERTLAVIRQDILNAATVILHQHGCSFVPEGTRGATDGTQVVAQALREQWQR
jgi:hypothetical protein